MLHDSDFNMRKQFYEASKREAQLKDLGYANSWPIIDGEVKAPEIVEKCEKRGHTKERINRGNCLNEYRCPICGYKYLVDSSG